MSYLLWTSSPWYAYAHDDGGEADDAVLIAWHASGAHAAVTAADLLRAGCEKQPERLRSFLERRMGNEPPAMKDVVALAPAVDRFVVDICNGGKIPMPPEVGNRYRELTRLVYEAVNQPRREQAVDSRDFPTWFAWSAELDEMKHHHPPPPLSRGIRDLKQTRALRMLRGEEVTSDQDALERARIAAASEWPPCEGRDRDDTSGDSVMKLWTTRSVYNASGEGETVMACIGHAENAEEAKAAFVEIFGEFFGRFSVSVEGVARDPVVELLFSEELLDTVAGCEGRATVVAQASLRVNRS